ncbi:MAG: hypothetical protein IT162_04860 [Bryobacterales bacterium]|nr:hypothetical protein [Bryobacterales bacterium]
MTDIQLAAFSQLRVVLEGAHVRWLVTDAARWPVEVAVPASRFAALALPEVAGFSVTPMDDAALDAALFDHDIEHFRMVGAACDAAGIDWAVTGALAMRIHGLPEWPDWNSRTALVSDLSFHEKLTLSAGVHKTYWLTGGGGQVMFLYPAHPFAYFWHWGQVPRAVVRNGLKVAPIETLLAETPRVL